MEPRMRFRVGAGPESPPERLQTLWRGTVGDALYGIRQMPDGVLAQNAIAIRYSWSKSLICPPFPMRRMGMPTISSLSSAVATRFATARPFLRRPA